MSERFTAIRIGFFALHRQPQWGPSRTNNTFGTAILLTIKQFTIEAGPILEKVALFVDVQNIYYTTKQAFNCNFDYNAFWKMATHNRQVVKATAYAIDRNDEKQKKFQNILRAIGFEVKLKPFIQRSDGSSKGDWDVGITLDVIEHVQTVDIVVLASGDGDFDQLVDRIRNKYRVAVEVYGVEQLTASSLIRAASKFVPIEKELLLNQR